MASQYGQPKGLTKEQKRLRAERIKKKKRKQKIRKIMMIVLSVVGVIAVGVIIYCLIKGKGPKPETDPTFILSEEAKKIPTKAPAETTEKRDFSDDDPFEATEEPSPEPSGEPTESETEETEEPEEPAHIESEEDRKLAGKLSDRGLWKDIDSLSNKSIPYGNDWEEKDAKTNLANGIFWYEGKYGFYHQLYRMKTDQKEIYLTFDEGYEYGYTPKILDTLKEKNVKAVFFITKEFLDGYPQYVERMIKEGHVIGNHTCLHPSGGFPLYVDQHGMDSFVNDVSKLHQMVYDRFGYTMKLFRFPEGEASERLMAKLDNLGYTSVFWSYAHRDFDTDNQPAPDVTLNRCLSHLGNGSIYLLHAVSSSNTAVLGDFIDQARALGYEFKQIPVDSVSAR